jgi:hypothetical protein
MEFSREDQWRSKQARRDKRLRLELSRPELLHQRNQTFHHRECLGLSPRYRGESGSRQQENERTNESATIESANRNTIYRFTEMAVCAIAVGVHWGSVVFGPMLTITAK